MDSSELPPEDKIKILKRKYGLAYGLTAGLAFAIALYGYDGFLLSQAHAYHPWVKLVAGGFLSMLAGGFAGWLTACFEKPLLGMIFWLAASGLMAWFTFIVPFVLAPFLMKSLSPELEPLLRYELYEGLSTRIGVIFTWIFFSSFVTSVIQIPLIDQAVFSVSAFGKLTPCLTCAILLAISGAIVDNFNNQSMRDPLINIDRIIQFSLDNRGKEIDKKVARELHLAALRTVEDVMQEQRKLVVTRYDELNENIHVAINFDGHWADCLTIVGIPINCEPISP